MAEISHLSMHSLQKQCPHGKVSARFFDAPFAQLQTHLRDRITSICLTTGEKPQSRVEDRFLSCKVNAAVNQLQSVPHHNILSSSSDFDARPALP